MGDVSAIVSSDVRILNSGSSSYAIINWSNFVVYTDNNRLIEFERITSEVGTTEGSVGVS